MERIHVDPAELTEAAARLLSVGGALTPLSPSTPRGLGVYGFPVLNAAVEHFLESVDASVQASATRLASQADNLKHTAHDFEGFESDARSQFLTLLRRL